MCGHAFFLYERSKLHHLSTPYLVRNRSELETTLSNNSIIRRINIGSTLLPLKNDSTISMLLLLSCVTRSTSHLRLLCQISFYQCATAEPFDTFYVDMVSVRLYNECQVKSHTPIKDLCRQLAFKVDTVLAPILYS